MQRAEASFSVCALFAGGFVAAPSLKNDRFGRSVSLCKSRKPCRFEFKSGSFPIVSASDSKGIVPAKTEGGITYVYDPSLNAMRPKEGQQAPTPKQGGQTSAEDLKRLAAEKAIEKYAKSGMCIGLGAGSTIVYAVSHLARLINEGKLSNIQVVCNSSGSEAQARSLGLTVVPLHTVAVVHVAIDGADEVDPELNLLKGRGYCAVVRDRITESLAETFVVICDDSKLVTRLASLGPVPVEVVPFGWKQVAASLEEQCGGRAELVRDKAGEPLLTDNANYVLHLAFDRPPHISSIRDHILPTLRACPGVVDNGFFLNLAHAAIVADKTGRIRELRRSVHTSYI